MPGLVCQTTAFYSVAKPTKIITIFLMTSSIQKYQLKNGLTVILEPNNASPIISLNVGVKVGSAWENENEAGLSHLLEHMVFKGTPHYGPGEIAQIVEASGGELNAYTSLDQTVYYINLASKHTAKGLNILSEMVFKALIDPVELEREKEVVLEEIRRGKDSPHREMSEALFSLVYHTHPYGRPVIGSFESVKNFPRDQVFDFYKKWYVPNNMVLVICGDYREDEIKKYIDQEFGCEPEAALTRPVLPTEPPQTAPRLKSMNKTIEGTYLSLAYPIPHFTHEDIPALDLLSHLLGEGDTSRLEQNIKEKQGLVNSIGSYAYTPTFPGVLVIQAVLPQKTQKNVVEAILEEVDYFRSHHVDEKNLQRSKLNIKSSVYYEKETCEGSARKRVSFETTAGDYRYEDTYLKAIDTVTPEHIRNVACRYLKNERISGIVLQGQKSKFKLTLPGEKKKTALKKNYVLIEEKAGVKKYRFRNGLTFLARENHRVPLASIYLSAPGGLRAENSATNGLSQLMASTISKGTLNKSALEIAEIAESMAGSIGGFAGRNTWGMQSGFLSEKKEAALELFTDVLCHPAFEQDQVEKEKRLQLEAIRNQQDSVAHMAFQRFSSLLYKKHPYGLPLLGEARQVQRFTAKQTASFYKKLCNPKKMVLSAAGDFCAEDLALYLSEQLGHLPSSPFTVSQKTIIKPKQAQKTFLKKDKMQSHLVVGFLTSPIKNTDRYALEVMSHVLSGQGGRLFLELRDKKSLAYTVSSSLVEGLDTGHFSVYIGSEPKKMEEALKGILEELGKLKIEKIPSEELERAKNYIIGNYEIDFQRNSTVAANLAINELYGLGFSESQLFPERISSVTAESVLSVARKYLNLDAYTLSLVGP